MSGRPGYGLPGNPRNPFSSPQEFYQQPGRPYDAESDAGSVYERRDPYQSVNSTTSLANDPFGTSSSIRTPLTLCLYRFHQQFVAIMNQRWMSIAITMRALSTRILDPCILLELATTPKCQDPEARRTLILHGLQTNKFLCPLSELSLYHFSDFSYLVGICGL